MNYKKGYAVGGEIREGENENIDSGSRSRAMAVVERLNKGKDVESARAAPVVRKRATKSTADRSNDNDGWGDEARPAAPPAERSMSKSYNDVPSIDEVRTANRDRQSSTSTSSRLKDTAGKALAGLGIAGGAAMGVQAGRSILAAGKAARAARNPAAKRARERYEDTKERVDSSMKEFVEAGNYAKGGMIGCAPRDYGKK